MKKILLTSAMALAFSGVFFAEVKNVAEAATSTNVKTNYISPMNNDGTQDTLVVPIKINEKRHVMSWSFVIENEKEETIRTIGFKEKRDAKFTFKKFAKALVTPKAGVDIPKNVMWNGVMDNGEFAPDGTYYYYLTATDDNGNTAKTGKHIVIVDNTPPEINLTQPTQEGKIFGEGAKTVLGIKQSGSSEDLWSGKFTNAKGEVVKTITWTTSEPLDFKWNGTNDAGLPVADGIYKYEISAIDRAGNKSEPAAITNILFSAEKPATNIVLSDGKYFAPKGNSSATTISFDVKIPLPKEESGNKLVGWSIVFLDENGKAIKTISGTDNPPSKVTWDGKDDNGNDVAEGNAYQATVKAKYLNGYETAPVNSPVFTLDNTAPKVKLAFAKEKIFSPDGDGNLDTIKITQTLEKDISPINSFKGKIVNARGETVKEFDFGNQLDEIFEWDGYDSSNQVAENGDYSYIINALDMAGNSSEEKLASIKLDTKPTELSIILDKTAFNPNRPANIRIMPKATTDIKEYTVSICDIESGEVVWDETKTADKAIQLPVIHWDGKKANGELCKDGSYIVMLDTVAVNENSASTKSQKFVIDTVPPKVELNVPYSIFSPDSDGQKDSIPIIAKTSEEESWVARVYNSNNESVKTYTWKGSISSFDFDGTDSNGNILADGIYSITFTSEDAAGNKASETIPNIKVDNRETKAYITAEEEYFSPNSDGKYDEQIFTVKNTLNEDIENWSFEIATVEGNVVKKWSNEVDSSLSIPEKINWDGKGDDGNIVKDNAYKANLKVVYKKGNIVNAETGLFISCVTPPQLKVSTAPQYFSPDNDGEDDDLEIFLKGDSTVPLKNWTFNIYAPNTKDPNAKGPLFWSTSGKSSITEKLIWDGYSNTGTKEVVQSAMDYPYTFTVTDSLGMTSVKEGKIEIDILVIKVGDKLKMQVPSIIFRSDAADFGIRKVDANGKVITPGITEEQAAKNERTLKRVAQLLNKFKSYKVTVEGHANSQSGSKVEEEQDTPQYGPGLLRLSKERAEFVKGKLKSYGVSASRLSTEGKGGTEPVVNRTDKDNNWKNRRVEFILDKNK